MRGDASGAVTRSFLTDCALMGVPCFVPQSEESSEEEPDDRRKPRLGKKKKKGPEGMKKYRHLREIKRARAAEKATSGDEGANDEATDGQVGGMRVEGSASRKRVRRAERRPQRSG